MVHSCNEIGSTPRTSESWTPVAQLDAAGHVTDQFSFDPYGTLLSYDDTSYDRPMLEVGHQGLFFDRLDVSLLNSDGSENPKQAVGAVGIYYNRARTYSPQLGRFLQADPNASGMAMEELEVMGKACECSLEKPSIVAAYSDSHSLFTYQRENPIGQYDPTGRFALALDGLSSPGIRLKMASDDSQTSLAAGANVFLNVYYWEQVGITIGGGAFLLSSTGQDVLNFIQEETGVDLLGGVAAHSGTRLGVGDIDGALGPDEHNTHGDPKDWKFQYEKNGSGRPGDKDPTDTKIYEVWMDAYRKLVELHYHVNINGTVNAGSVKLKPYSP